VLAKWKILDIQRKRRRGKFLLRYNDCSACPTWLTVAVVSTPASS